jgi:hypothetical protein
MCGLSHSPGGRRCEPHDQSAGGGCEHEWGHKCDPVLHHREWSDSGGAVHIESRRNTRWRRARSLLDSRALGRAGLRLRATRLCRSGRQPQRRFPHTDKYIRRRIGGGSFRSISPKRFRGPGASQQVVGHLRSFQSKRQHGEYHAIRMEGAEHILADVCRRSLQRGRGDHQRPISQ